MDRPSKHLERMSPEQRAELERFRAERKARAQALHDEWWPGLLQLSQAQPQTRPLTRREQAQVNIVCEMISRLQTEDRFNLEDDTYLFSLPRWAMAAAQELWPGQARHAVWLDPETAAGWTEQYFAQVGLEAPYWFIHYWWEVDAPAPEGTDLKNFPQLLEPWLGRSGVIWNSMAGGQDATLWSWDGDQASFVEIAWVESY